MYPIGEKTEVADSEKRTPEVKFRLFFSTFQNIFFSQRSIFLTPLDRASARLKATIGGFYGALTFFIENQSFFDNSFNLYLFLKRWEFGLGRAIFGIREVDFLP